MDKVLGMLGLAKKAGRLEVGEEPVGGAARAREARLILVAQDAADNTIRRVRHFADAGQCLWVKVPATKDELGRAVGRTSCAMVAVTDIGFAEAAAKKLAAVDEAFAETVRPVTITFADLYVPLCLKRRGNSKDVLPISAAVNV